MRPVAGHDPRSYVCMSNAPSTPAGHAGVPVHQLEAILDALAQVAGQLESIACDLSSASQSHGTTAVQTELERRVEHELLANLCRGKESIAASALAEGLSGILQDEGIQLSVSQARRMLPPMMLRLFGCRLSCSVKGVDGRHVRGYRGVAFRIAAPVESSPT